MISIEIPYNVEEYTPVDIHRLWGDTCRACLLNRRSTRDLRPMLERSVEQAQKIRHEALSALTAARILNTIKSDYGIGLSWSFSYDRQDLVGLIGEMLVEDLFQSATVTGAVIKWKTTGTSKSRGIDFLCRVASLHPPDVLLLVESKHLHEEARGRSSLQPSILAERFDRGISGFEEEKTLFNLALVLLRLSRSIGIDRSVKSNTLEKRALRGFIAEHLRDQEYDCAVVVSVDDRLSDIAVTQQATHLVQEPSWIAGRTVSLAVVTFRQLEHETDRLCERFARRD